MTATARDAGRFRGRAAPPSARSARTGAPAKSTAKRRSSAVAVPPTRAVVPVVAGAVWAVALVGAVAVSSFLTAGLLAVVGVVATASGMRATEARTRSRGARGSRRPSLVLVVALAGAALNPLVALGGVLPAVALLLVSVGVVGALVLSSGYAASARPLRTVGSRLVVAVGPMVAASCLVLARHQGSSLAVALVVAVLAFDAAAFLMGNARTPLGGPVGVASGVVSVAVVALFVAAVMDPPFSGARPWVAFAFVAVAAPLGVRLAQTAGKERLPALRRIDSLLVTAPLWVLTTALLLHR